MKHPHTPTSSDAMDVDADVDSRPLKRQRVAVSSSSSTTHKANSSNSPTKPSSSTPTSQQRPSQPTQQQPPPPLTDPHLLLALPTLLIQPPTSPHHARSLHLSRMSLHKCLSLAQQQLDRDLECRAWTGLVEVGLRILALPSFAGTGVESVGDDNGRELEERLRAEVEREVEKGVMKGLIIAQQHPSLRPYIPHLTHLSTHLPSSTSNLRKITTSLKRLISSFYKNSDERWMAYRTHLALIHAYIQEFLSSSSTSTSSSPVPGSSSGKSSHLKILGANSTLRTLASQNNDTLVVLLTHVLKVRVLVLCGVWKDVGGALEGALGAFGVSPAEGVRKEEGEGGDGEDTPSKTKKKPTSLSSSVGKMSLLSPTKPGPSSLDTTTSTSQTSTTQTTPSALSPHETKAQTALLIHLRFLSVLYHTYAGDTPSATAHLKELHGALDQGGLESLGEDGVVQLPLKDSPPLHLTLTHPQTFYILTFLLSAQTKRDPVGRNPKRRVFGVEGVKVCERSLSSVGKEGKEGVKVSRWANFEQVKDLEKRVHCVKAELLCEVVSVALMRCEFGEAEKILSQLISHTRTHLLFPRYASRITLFYAQMAHAKGSHEEAGRLYAVAAHLAGPRSASSSKKSSPKEVKAKEREREEMKGRGSPMKVDTPTKSSTSSSTMIGEMEVDVDDKDEDEEDVEGEEDPYVHVSARAGLLVMKIGLYRSRMKSASSSPRKKEDWISQRKEEWRAIKKEGEEVAKLCFGLGGSLGAVGEVILACFGAGSGVADGEEGEILTTKTHLRTALSLSTRAQDNYLRLLVMCLIAAHYMHTAPDSAMAMLKTGEVLALGLGARKGDKEKGTPKASSMPAPAPSTPSKGVGKEEAVVPVRLWIGERFCDLYRWFGEEEEASKREKANEELRKAVGMV